MPRNPIARVPFVGCLCLFLLIGCTHHSPSGPSGSPDLSGQSAASSRSGQHYAVTQPSTRPHNYAQWEKAMAAFETKDKTNPPPRGAIEFTGSSMIARWKTLNNDFPSQPVFNRGFGGSMICDVTHYADRMIFPYEPKMIFLRCGGNDLHAGKSVEAVFDDYKQFVDTVHAKLPKTTIVWIGLCPAPVRWSERDANKLLNEMVKSYSSSMPYLKYIECYDISVTPDGQVREELFVADRLHFNADGYKLMTERVRPFVSK